MRKARSRLTTVLAGVTLCICAVAAYGQDQSTTNSAPTGAAGTAVTPDAGASAATQSNPATTAPQATTPTTGKTTTSARDITTTTATTRNFPGGFWGIVATGIVVLLILIALIGGRNRTVVRETYASSATTSPSDRSVSTGTAVGDRTLITRTASGTETTRTEVNERPPGA
jgi:hypothetical protein